jgi:sugar-specific transcriptional regulator TrmB/biotin operon repressor
MIDADGFPDGVPAAARERELLDAVDSLAALSRRAVEQSELVAALAESLVSAGPQPRTRESGVVHISGLDNINAAIRDLLRDATDEILTAQPGGARPGAVLDDAFEAVRERLEAGAAMRTIYQHTARFDEPTKSYARTVIGYGVEIRTLDEFFDRLVIVDRTAAVIPANDERTRAAEITEPAVVRFLVGMFERAWSRATPFPFVPTRSAEAAAKVVPEIHRSIQRLLVEGQSDRAIARRLGISERSLQAHIRRIKQDLGASTRLQLGYRLAVEERGAAQAGSAAQSRPRSSTVLT